MAKQLTSAQMTALFEEIAEAYNAQDEDNSLDADDYYEIFDEDFELEGFNNLEDDSGHEGHGEQCHTIFQWKGVVYKAEYNYYSHEGTCYDYLTIRTVQPVEKTVIVWE